ncbi:hypothetical protein CHS0354_002708 [Potamilus streckersoni]|uniref:Uncharacterized protein n=1 Tax=Potamilus streckersoni TaxID=2493646 RepID=A0AAE0VX42_9BIVA|nr:hypothetical protein CHS0354_002708 [Potamilus streckersoni]
MRRYTVKAYLLEYTFVVHDDISHLSSHNRNGVAIWFSKHWGSTVPLFVQEAHLPDPMGSANSLENDKLNYKLCSLDRLSHKQAVKLHGDIFELRKEVYQRKKNALPLALRYTRHFDHSHSDFGSVCSASSSEYSLTTSVQGSPSTYRRSLASISLDLSSDWDDSNSSCSRNETCSSTDSTSSSQRRRASRMEAAERAEDKRLENLHRRYASHPKNPA